MGKTLPAIGDTGCDDATKAARYQAKIAAAFNAGATGYLLWNYNQYAPAGYCDFDFGATSPLLAVFPKF